VKRATAIARTNIALVKYWGKRGASALNLPAVGSLSLTLEGLSTKTTVEFSPSRTADRFVLNDKEAAGEPYQRLVGFLDLVRERAGLREFAEVVSANDFPTAAGLASSASGFAALALAATHAAEVDISARDLSILARRGSGSAARSIFGGFVQMHRGSAADGNDAFAEPIASPALDVRMVVAVTTEAQKDTLSTRGMKHTAETSPYFAAWTDTSDIDIADAKAAIAAGDFVKLGEVTERSCLTMHASALAARPAVVYFRGVTIDGFHAIAELRKSGVPAYFTCDAGPHIKALTLPAHAEKVAARLKEIPGVLYTRICAPGKPAEVIE
jgi:diphosphomevalonate decarboxylase